MCRCTHTHTHTHTHTLKPSSVKCVMCKGSLTEFVSRFWVCVSCTFRNAELDEACVMCTAVPEQMKLVEEQVNPLPRTYMHTHIHTHTQM
jgi:hypothetical protein